MNEKKTISPNITDEQRVTISFITSKAMQTSLKAFAKREDRSMSSLLRQIVAEGLERRLQQALNDGVRAVGEGNNG